MVREQSEEGQPTRAALLERLQSARAGLGSRAASAGRQAARRVGETEPGRRLQKYATDWTEELDARIDVSGDQPAPDGPIPEDGDLVLCVHGFLGEGRLDAVSVSGAHQAAAFQVALDEEFAAAEVESPPVVAVMWGSSTVWTRAKQRTRAAGATLAAWLEANRDRYDSVTIVGHSLGARVTLWALQALDSVTVDSVALLGAAVSPDSVCTQYCRAIETRVEGPVYNYYSENDAAVCYLYRLTELSPGLGCRGSDCGGGMLDSSRLPENYVDVDVTESVHNHRDYYRPSAEAFDGESCVDTLVANRLQK